MSGQLKNDIGERKLRVTLLSAGWKASSDEDLTTINRELAIQMAKHPNVEVSVFLPQCSEEDKKDADSYNVKLIEAVKLSGFEPVDWLASVPEGHAMDCVLGHGVALGRLIPLIKKNPNYSHCKWIQVVHTAPEEIGMYRNISEGQQMQQTEIELCEMADQVVTIGLKLTEAYKNQLGKKDVFNLTPSILSEFSDVRQASDERRTFCALVIESGDSEDFDVKGYKIAAKAIANLKDKSYQLKFASKQSGKEDELKHKLLQCGIDHNQLIICSFDENRKTLANLFSMVDIVLLPSKTEGFGLSALKAISAGLPVLVSGNSGIAEALKEVPNGSQCIVDSEDPADWARAIKVVHTKKRNVRLREAKILRGNYLQQFSWEEHCDFLVTKMCNLAFGGEMNIKVDVDDLEPERQNMQTGMLATESVQCQEVQQPGVSATSAASGSVSYSQTEDLHALKVKTFLSIIKDSFHSTKPQSIEECNQFKEYAKEMKVIIVGVSDGSLVITVKCESLMILENLWTDYSSGHLGEVVQNCFVTEKILKELNLAELRLKTTMDIEEYNACKMFFEKDALRDALSSEFHSTSSTSESPLTKELWEKSEQKTKIMEMAKLEDQKLNIKVDVEHVKRADQDAYNTASVLALEPAGYQKASTASGTKRKGHSDADLEDLQPLKKKVLCLIAMNYLDTTPAQSRDEHNEFKEYLQEMKVFITGVSMERLVITVKCDSLSSLEELWDDYSCGLLDKMVRDCFVTEKILKELNLAELKLKTTMDTEEYNAYKLYFLEKDALRGASSSEFHSISSTSESPQSQEELKKWKQKTKIVETEKLKGMLPLHGSYTSDPEEELEELRMKLQSMKGSSSPPLLSTIDLEEKLRRVCVNLKMLRVEGGFPVLQFSTIDLEKKLDELCMEFQRSRMEGTLPPPELFTADLEDELKGLRTELNRVRMKGSSHPLVSTIQVELGELLKQLQKWRKEEFTMADHLMNMLTQTSEEEIQAVVDKCWQDIGYICGDETVKKSLSSPFDPRIRGWRVVRLFVSSTFADYHAEREVLVKKVVPELREWCEEKSINLIECDLRWGVPKDSTIETTIRTCLGEINRCAAEADGEPFFLNMLGERYGWIPASAEISEEVQEEYQWIFPTSITHMEIIHAAYKMQNKNAVFLLRDSEFLADLPPQMMKAFVDDHPLNKAHLKALKENLRQRYPGQVFDYSCQYGGIDESTGRSKVKLKGLEVFCQIVLEFFKSAINRLIPTVNQTLSVEEIELSMHNQFIELRGQLVLGRGEEITTVMNYVQHGTISDGSGSGRLPPLIVLGSSGSGKSALMAYCTLEIQNLGLPLFFHFVGACPGSTVPLKLLEKLVRWFNKGFSVEDMSVKQLQQEIKEGVEELGKREEVFVIMIDAVNQLSDVESQEHMDWLPSSFPHNVRCVISAVTDSRSVILLYDERRALSPVPLPLPDLDTSARQEIVEHKLGKYNKKLDAEQMKLLIYSEGASSPLWLSLSCEELRVFGVFENITQYIKDLPSPLKKLLEFIMNRLTAEDEDDNIQKVLGLLACSRGGLGETELQYLLSDDLSKAVAMMVWAQVRRTLKPFLRNVAGRREEERLDFFHASIQEVVLETILQDSEEKKKFHLKLADYFELHCKDKDRVIFMAPEQLKLAGKRKRLLEFLRNEERSGKPGQWKDRYYEDFRCDMRLLPGTAFSHNVHICRFCDMKRGAFGEHSCFICGRFTPWRNDMQAARVCHAHELPGPPNLVMCYLCRKPAFIDYAMVYLCALCENVAIKRCAMLVTD